MKINCNAETMRLTWCWPQDIQQAYVTVNGETALYTVQEYKRRGGFFISKEPGVYDITVQPFVRENGEDIIHEQMQNTLTYTCKNEIFYTLSTKTGEQFANHEITLLAAHAVSRGVIGYTKTNCNHEYFFEPLAPNQPLIRIVRTKKDEKLHLFITKDFLGLCNFTHTTPRTSLFPTSNL